MTINICSDFSETPGARYISEGDYSGEEFRNKILVPRYEEAKKKNDTITVELDGGYGYPTSFLEEAFGGLARIYGSNSVNNMFTFISEDEPSLVEEIREYIIHANDKK